MCGVSSTFCRGVELSHELTVRGPGGGQVVALLFELESEVDDLLLHLADLLVEGVDVGGCREPGLAPGLLAERLPVGGAGHCCCRPVISPGGRADSACA